MVLLNPFGYVVPDVSPFLLPLPPADITFVCVSKRHGSSARQLTSDHVGFVLLPAMVENDLMMLLGKIGKQSTANIE